MNVRVFTTEPIDLGDGPATDFVFVSAKHHVDRESGALHIQTDLPGAAGGNVASFAGGQWRAVVRGDVIEQPRDSDTGPLVLSVIGGAE